MIYLRIYGGLGNQIFQLAAALFLAQKWGKSAIQIDEDSLMSYAAKRDNQLIHVFDFDKLQKGNIKITWKRNDTYYTKAYWLFNLVLGKGLGAERKFLKSRGFVHFFSKLISKYFINDVNYSYVVKNGLADKVLMDGYFQQCWSQADIEQSFKFLQTIYKKDVNTQLDENECIIHIRGTDFLNTKLHNLLDQDYYQKAAKQMVDQYGVEKFVVVTDDVEYAKYFLKTFSYAYRFYTQGLKSDFDLISSARKKILANSTFSITACLLGSKDQVVIAPLWMTTKSKRTFKLPGEVTMSYNLK